MHTTEIKSAVCDFQNNKQMINVPSPSENSNFPKSGPGLLTFKPWGVPISARTPLVHVLYDCVFLLVTLPPSI